MDLYSNKREVTLANMAFSLLAFAEKYQCSAPTWVDPAFML